MDPHDVQYYRDRQLNWQPYEGNPTSLYSWQATFASHDPSRKPLNIWTITREPRTSPRSRNRRRATHKIRSCRLRPDIPRVCLGAVEK